MLRREPVIDNQHSRFGGARNPSRERAMRIDRADNVAAAVQVKHRAAGVGSITEIVKRVLASGRAQVLAVCGRNEKASRSLQRARPPRGSALKVYGFVDDIASLMAAADLFVGKSGGLTTAECLAMGLPMIVYDPIPGQEERNCDFLLESGAGVKAHGPASLSYKLETLLADPARLQRMKQAARRAAHPRAAEEILRLIEK